MAATVTPPPVITVTAAVTPERVLLAEIRELRDEATDLKRRAGVARRKAGGRPLGSNGRQRWLMEALNLDAAASRCAADALQLLAALERGQQPPIALDGGWLRLRKPGAIAALAHRERARLRR